VKLLVLVPAALLIAAGLFVTMALMVAPDGSRGDSLPERRVIEFDRVTLDSETRERDRRPPPPPPEPLEPPDPDLMRTDDLDELQPLPLDVAALDIDSVLDLDTGIALSDRLVDGRGSEVQPGYVPFSELTPVSRVPPQYPLRAHMQEIEGWVELSISIDERGAVEDVTVLDADPEGVFESAAVTAVRSWRFRPRIEDGRPSAVRARTTIRFAVQRGDDR
jgi:protein TonB